MKALEMANYIVWYANSSFDNADLTNLKLQKILYYVTTTLIKKNMLDNAFSEAIGKWKLGPVFPSVYHEFKNFGGRPITSTIPNIRYIENPHDESDFDFEIEEFDGAYFEACHEHECSIAREVVDALIQKDAFELVNMTHKESAWSNYESLIKEGDRTLEYNTSELKDARNII
ncbi:type II toxin-antitoxin system antitoxin SocA domain-containing protein [Acinetobacter schindleri]|uniref:Panacea domain-containing protein n=1 Tax=Acinetobacter schindleri TaxID=108981 RepID=UPI003A898FC1